MKHHRVRVLILPVLLALLLAAACVPVQAPAAPAAATPLNVFAAASLKDAFEAMAPDFEAAHPGADLVFNFAGSQALVQQLGEGAPADVFAAAATKPMTDAITAGRVDAGAPALFARNRLVVIYPADNPAGIATLQDLAQPGLKLVLAAAEVPVGGYTRQFLAKASASPDFTPAFSETVIANVVSYEDNVRAVLTKVQLGEADAGVVYVSDAPPSITDVGRLDIPDDLNVLAAYPIAVVNDSTQPALAQAFVAYVLGEQGQATLAQYGLIPAAGAP